jgi:hypothetical protein
VAGKIVYIKPALQPFGSLATSTQSGSGGTSENARATIGWGTYDIGQVMQELTKHSRG